MPANRRLVGACILIFLAMLPAVSDAGARQLVTRAASGASATASGGVFLAQFPRQQLSDDGRFYVFASAATNLVAGQSGGGIQVFLYDRALDSVTLVSHAAGSNTAGGNATSFTPTISGDGQWVAFCSDSSNLIAGYMATGSHQVYLWSRATNTTTLASHAPGLPAAGTNEAETPSLSYDGRYLVFSSFDSFEFTDLSNAFPDVVLYDRVADTRTLVSHLPGNPNVSSSTAASAMWGSFSWSATISADGAYVLFNSDATDLVAGQVDTNDVDDLFLFERSTGSIRLVTHADGSPTLAAASSSGLGADPIAFFISADGSYVAYNAVADDLVAGQSGVNFGSAFLYSRASDSTTLVGHVANDPSAVLSFAASPVSSMSPDGRFVVFTSDSAEVVAGVSGVLGNNVYVFDRNSGSTTLVSHKPGLPLAAINGATDGQVTADGGLIMFDTDKSVPGFTDTNNTNDVFAWDRATDSLALATFAAGSPGTTSNGTVFVAEISRSGFVTVLNALSSATNLTVNDLNNANDIFLYSNSTTPSVTSLSHSNVTGASADVAANVSADGGVLVTERGFVYAMFDQEPNPKVGLPGVVSVPQPGTTGAFGVTLNGLATSTHYAYAAYAKNVLGTSYTAASEFVTSGAAAPTTTSLSSSRNPSNVGESVTLTAAVSGASPSGAVTFEDGGGAIPGCAGVPLSATFSAKCVTASLGAGTHAISAAYSGDAANSPSSGSLGGGQWVIAPTSVAAGDVRITQFRFRGTSVAGSGEKNEYVEVTNGQNVDVTIGADGWALSASPGGVLAIIPGGTILKAGGSFLFTNGDLLQGFVTGPLANYPAYTPVVPSSTVVVGGGDIQFAGDIADGAGIALFKSGVVLDGSTRLDSVGFSGVADPLYREGVGLTPAAGVTVSGDFAFVRKAPNGVVIDTDNNGNDFQVVSTDAGAAYTGAPSQLGAPGPRSSLSGRWLPLSYSAIEPLASGSAAPNRAADLGASPKRIEFRFRVTNNTGQTISSIRWRFVRLTNLNAPGYSPGGPQADLRPVSGATRTIAPATSIGVSQVQGLSLETPPAQPMGGGLNSTLVYALPSPLANGASVDVNMVFEVYKGGSFAFTTVSEGRVP